MIWENLVPLEQVPRVRLVHDVARSSLQRFATITPHHTLNDPGSCDTSEPKRSGTSSVNSYTTTGIPLAFTPFMIPWMKLARKLSELLFIVRR